MADITNPAAVRFCNEKARRMADLTESFRRTAQQFLVDIQSEWEAYVGGNADGDVIVDGSATDGRQILTKVDIGALKYRIEQGLNALVADDGVVVVAKVSVNGAPLF